MKLSTTVVDSLVVFVPVGMLKLPVLWSLMCSDSVGCRSRWFLLLRTEPKAAAPCAGCLPSSSVEQPLSVLWYFGSLCHSLLAHSMWRSWNLPLYNLVPCLCCSGSLCCWQHCHGLAVPAGPSDRPSWPNQAPELCCLVRCSFDLFLNSYVPCNITSSSAVFLMYLYPRMMQNSNSQIVSLLPDFWYD